MKKFSPFTMFIFAAILLISMHNSILYANSVLSIPLSINYASTYWWRGVELNGRSVGVLWLGLGIELVGSGLTFNVYSAISQDYLSQSDSSDLEYNMHKKTQKAKTEFDYGFNYEKTIAEMFVIGVGLYYIHYPFYDEDKNLNADPSFLEASLSFGAKTILNPKLIIYYDYYVEENDAQTPVNEDYYLNLSFSQSLLEYNEFSFSLGCWIGYYNNAYLDAKGFSDAGISSGFSYVKGNATFNSVLYFARSLTKDFQIEYKSVGILKNHIWVEFEMIYKI